MAEVKRRFTPEQEAEICDKYLTNEYTMRDLAQEYGCSTDTVWKIIRRSENIEVAEHNASLRARLSLLKLKNASADAAEKLVMLMNKQRSDKQVYADIQLIQQVLDRAGVREQREEKQDISVTFNTGGIKLGVPDHSKDKKE
jgi:transposase-like protein